MIACTMHKTRKENLKKIAAYSFVIIFFIINHNDYKGKI